MWLECERDTHIHHAKYTSAFIIILWFSTVVHRYVAAAAAAAAVHCDVMQRININAI